MSGSTPAQKRLLVVLANAGRPLDARELAREIGPTAYSTLRACVERGWVEWDPDAEGYVASPSEEQQ